MNCSAHTALHTTARVLLPPGPIFSRTGAPQILRVIIWRTSITTRELEAFLQKYGFAPDGKTERCDGTRDDGLIELEHTVPNVRTHHELLQKACVFANELEEHFSGIEEVTVH